ncbi:MAG TPA: hypothetical protein PKE42_01460, partial [Arachnia sp.]|nr:hypothetical protein [Arachnia sp.]
MLMTCGTSPVIDGGVPIRDGLGRPLHAVGAASERRRPQRVEREMTGSAVLALVDDDGDHDDGALDDHLHER